MDGMPATQGLLTGRRHAQVNLAKAPVRTDIILWEKPRNAALLLRQSRCTHLAQFQCATRPWKRRQRIIARLPGTIAGGGGFC